MVFKPISPSSHAKTLDSKPLKALSLARDKQRWPLLAVFILLKALLANPASDFVHAPKLQTGISFPSAFETLRST
jgi:hypothetical protein